MYNEEINKDFLERLDKVNSKLLNYLLASTHSKHEAEDIFQDAVLIAYEKYDDLLNKDAYDSYIFQIAVNLNKRKKWRNRLFKEYDEEKSAAIVDINSKSELSMETEILYKAIDKLKPKYKNSVILFEITGFSIKEIAKMERTTENTVKTRLRRGREQLADLLDVDEKNEEKILKFIRNEKIQANNNKLKIRN